MFDELLLKMKMHTWGSFCTDQKIPKKSANTLMDHGRQLFVPTANLRQEKFWGTIRK